MAPTGVNLLDPSGTDDPGLHLISLIVPAKVATVGLGLVELSFLCLSGKSTRQAGVARVQYKSSFQGKLFCGLLNQENMFR